ncbi:alginate lyase family protein [Microbulbifer sp. VAAF005]|uniref:alginate lyase family protein n=1 Tax=Microbulbifer sp. VAAF005 TaxID=3034230 RepID=UPI0024AD1AB6|nr:alginate lyase family protein [Microbulbifer sp. VAAF005]WHI46513.1 alginate lyase family protein [Microbulbifer sp. VAAF005]
MPIKHPGFKQKPITPGKDTFLIRWQNRRAFFIQKFKRKTLKYAGRLINAIFHKHRHFPNFYFPNSRPPYPKTIPSNSYTSTSDNAQTFILYRIIGNDLIPRHSAGQSYKNLEFILQHEPPLEGCKKVFILNRIVDPSEETAIIKLLCNYKQSYLRIPFHWDEYKEIGWNILDYPINYAPYKLKDLCMRRDLEIQAELGLYRHKNNYVMNNNGARNLALKDGKSKADWILPWDGNCFVSSKAWNAIKQQVLNHATYPYHIIPMARLLDNQSILREDFEPSPTEEPQVLFRSDSTEVFDSRFCYGRRPKVEFLWRLGVPGKWDDWAVFPWDLPCPDYSKDAGHYIQGAWVARLFSGKPHLERTDQQSSRERGETRSEAILTMLDQLDNYTPNKNTPTTMPSEPNSTGNLSFSYLTLLSEATQRAARAQQKLQSNSTDCLLQDLVIAGLAQSHKVRPEFSRLIDDSLLKLFPDTQDKANTRRLETANPSLLAHLLSTLKNLKQTHRLYSTRIQQLDDLLKRHLIWLTGSPCGQSMRSDLGYLGTQYDLQVAAVALYLDQTQIVRKTLRDSRFRILEQFDASGKQQPKTKGKNSTHYECLNLQLWIHLAELAMTLDENLWNFTARDGAGVQQGIRWFLQKFEIHRNAKDIDKQRLLPIINAYQKQYGELLNLRIKLGPKHTPQYKSIFPIETAIHPFWNLGYEEHSNSFTTTKKLTPEIPE